MNWNICRNLLAGLLPMVAFTNAQGEAGLVAHYDMDPAGGKITELVSGENYDITGNLMPESVAGAEGMAWRLDGYTSYAEAGINAGALTGGSMTMTLWCTMETYPMMNTAEAVNTSTYIAGNLDDEAKEGFAFLLSSQGDYSFQCYYGGWKLTCSAAGKLEKYAWNHLAAVVDGSAKEVKLYCNGILVGTSRIGAEGGVNAGKNTFMIGKSMETLTSGPFIINTINGIIDDIRIYDSALAQSDLGYHAPENAVNLSIPESRFENDLMRPAFHGMPDAGWTNECHGLTYYNGKYHVFFQKNANGPYMARLHWGHLSSVDMCRWEEEKIAIAPSESYDWKGCWSGCTFNDEELTGGKPYIFYTAVDNAKAVMAQAMPLDDNLVEWEKYEGNPVVNGRPAGLSDDFRDPYIFKFNGELYMIVGTSKDGVGAVTLHKYDKGSKTWSNDGKIFFKGSNVTVAGRFWEMPVIVPMKDDKWLFMATPLETGSGVEVLYWVGTLNSDATFNPLPSYQNAPKKFELDGMSSDGYGLLSPSLCMLEDGKYAAMGIVPDKLSSEHNAELGWAHTYSLPREISLDENDELVQKPFGSLTGLRSDIKVADSSFTLDGNRDLAPVEGRCVEVRAKFEVTSTNKVGFRFFGNDNGAVEVYYSPLSNRLTVDASRVARWSNDNGTFDGVYTSSLPSRFTTGDIFDLHVYVDHSIMDVFINEKWAFSVRLFPTEADAKRVEVFTEGNPVNFTSLEAYVLDGRGSGVVGSTTVADRGELWMNGLGHICYAGIPEGTDIHVYDLSGRLLAEESAGNGSGMLSYVPTKNCIASAVVDDRNISRKFIVK